MGNIFFVPNKAERDTKISKIDIKKGHLKIGAINKRQFSDTDCEIIIIFETEEYTCSLKTTEKGHVARVYTIELDKELASKLSLNTYDILEFRALDNGKYKVEKQIVFLILIYFFIIMKVLAFVDLHGWLDVLKQIKEKAINEDVDLINVT